MSIVPLSRDISHFFVWKLLFVSISFSSIRILLSSIFHLSIHFFSQKVLFLFDFLRTLSDHSSHRSNRSIIGSSLSHRLVVWSLPLVLVGVASLEITCSFSIIFWRSLTCRSAHSTLLCIYLFRHSFPLSLDLSPTCEFELGDHCLSHSLTVQSVSSSMMNLFLERLLQQVLILEFPSTFSLSPNATLNARLLFYFILFYFLGFSLSLT